MLTEKKKKYFKKLLTQRLDSLLEETKRPGREITDLKNDSSDFAEQASIESETDFTFRIKERERKLVLKIKKSLQRIENDTFGICEVCNGTISDKRLKARPITTMCINCKRKQEAEEKLRGI